MFGFFFMSKFDKYPSIFKWGIIPSWLLGFSCPVLHGTIMESPFSGSCFFYPVLFRGLGNYFYSKGMISCECEFVSCLILIFQPLVILQRSNRGSRTTYLSLDTFTRPSEMGVRAPLDFGKNRSKTFSFKRNPPPSSPWNTLL